MEYKKMKNPEKTFGFDSEDVMKMTDKPIKIEAMDKVKKIEY